MFSLPMLHLVATVAGAIILATLILVGAAYGIAAVRGAHVSSRGPVLPRVAVLGGLLLCRRRGDAVARDGTTSPMPKNGVVTGKFHCHRCSAIRLPLAVVTVRGRPRSPRSCS